LNPDAKVYCLGTYNFGNHFYLDDAKTVDLGSLMQTFANAFNLIIQGLCAKYQNCCFVNILNTETYSATVKEALATDLATLYESQFLYKFHPTLKGQAYIAEQVLKAWQDTDIAVTFDSDVQRVNSVRIDWRDDISADDFNAETHTLTVPYAKQNARVLYAAVTKTNGDKALIAYRLDYKQGGYSAKKLISVPLPNLGEAFDKALDSLQSTVRKLIK